MCVGDNVGDDVGDDEGDEKEDYCAQDIVVSVDARGKASSTY